MFKELRIWFVVIAGLISYNEGYATVPRTTDLFYTVANLNTVVMEEIWKPVVGYEDFYEVSNLGDVRGVDRYYVDSRGIKRFVKGRQLKAHTNGIGYYRVVLAKSGINKTHYVHRLVALAFIENVHGLPEVNHKNCKKCDNKKDNLEWCSSSYNHKHAYANGKTKPRPWLGLFGNEHGSSKPVVLLDDSNCVTREFVSLKDAGDKMGINFRLISRVCRGSRSHTHGYVFKFKEDIV